MFLVTDTQHVADRAATAGVLFDDWTAGKAVREVIHASAGPASAYVPGRLHLRELPGIVELLGQLDAAPDAIVIDAYVWLDAAGKPGLGAHLYEATGRRTAVIGVAKSAFAGATHAIAVTRGGSRRPLYVTAAGVDPARAAQWVVAMHGAHRIPTLLKRADRLCRDALAP